MVTIYKNLFDLTPHYISIDKALDRIKVGKSKDLIDDIRNQRDKERASKLKNNLPSVLFSGKFGNKRTDDSLIEHSGFIVLDFDYVESVQMFKSELSLNEFIYSCWISPSGNGVKALVKIADGKKHREHFLALKDDFDNLDNSGINESRVCFESYDPAIWINKNAKVYKKIKKVENVIQTNFVNDSQVIFDNILKWLANKGDSFVKGERNYFMYKLASACCRFGINQSECEVLCNNEFLIRDNTFTQTELQRVIQSAYRSNAASFGSAIFENEKLISKTTKEELQIDVDIYDESIKPKDVIFGEDVKQDALNIYHNGYERVDGIGCPIDDYYKPKRGEITLLSGIGNYGKSSLLKWYLVTRMLLFKEKIAIFAPEDNPAKEFYHDLTEIYLGANCTPANYNRPSLDDYNKAYDFVSKHIFFIYPKDIAPSPDYIKQRFLELIIKEKVSWCIIDPFNQMTNNYSQSGGRTDKYLETFLSDCSRFAINNDIFFLIVAHPHKMQKDSTGNYPCPDVFDIADGAMWNNKMDNILIYHRTNHQTDPNSNICEFHSKKIRRQKTVGKKGMISFELDRFTRRFYFDGFDVIEYIKSGDKKELPKKEVKEAFDDIPF